MGASLLNYNSRLTRNAIDGDIKLKKHRGSGMVPGPDCTCGCGLHEKAERNTMSSASHLFSRDESRMLRSVRVLRVVTLHVVTVPILCSIVFLLLFNYKKLH